MSSPDKSPPPAEEVRLTLKKKVRHPYITGQGLKREEPAPAAEEPAAEPQEPPPS